MTVHIRNSTERDLPNIIRLLNEDRRGSYEFTPYDTEALPSWIREAKIVIAEDDGGIIGSAAYSDGYWGEEIEWLLVPESQNQRSLQSTLLEEAEKYVKRGSVFTVVDTGSPRIKQWVELGYRVEGGIYHMVAVLTGVEPLPEVPEDTVLRCLKEDEEKEFVQAVNAGFGTERAKMGDIQRWKSESPPFDEEWIHVAEIDNKIVSVVVGKPDTRYNKSFNRRRGYLGPATTLSEHRGKNLASALTRLVMNLLFEKRMDTAALYASEQNTQSVALVQKLGFGVGHHWKFMRKTIPK